MSSAFGEPIGVRSCPPVGSQSDGILVQVDPFSCSFLPPSGPPGEIAISSAMNHAGVVNKMIDPGGISALRDAADAMRISDIVLQSVTKLADVRLVDFLSEVSLTISIENDSFLLPSHWC
jgi:hypothetical protein